MISTSIGHRMDLIPMACWQAPLRASRPPMHLRSTPAVPHDTMTSAATYDLGVMFGRQEALRHSKLVFTYVREQTCGARRDESILAAPMNMDAREHSA